MRTMAAGEFKAKCLQVMDQGPLHPDSCCNHEAWQADCEAGARRPAPEVDARASRQQDRDSRRHSLPGGAFRGLGGAEVILLDTHVLVWMVTDPKRLS
jgi:hypothetical protein